MPKKTPIDLTKWHPHEEFLTTREAAALTRMSEAYYERMRLKTGGPPYVKRGRVVRYAKSELLAWWEEGRSPTKR